MTKRKGECVCEECNTKYTLRRMHVQLSALGESERERERDKAKQHQQMNRTEHIASIKAQYTVGQSHLRATEALEIPKYR